MHIYRGIRLSLSRLLFFIISTFRFAPRGSRESALALFVFRILTNDANASFSLDDLALVADRLYRRSYFHRESSFRNACFGLLILVSLWVRRADKTARVAQVVHLAEMPLDVSQPSNVRSCRHSARSSATARKNTVPIKARSTL